MLNTLYPPTMPKAQFVQPTHQLTRHILASQRSGFFRYITAVEKHGTVVLKSLVTQGQRAGEVSGWPAVRETMDKYLRAANGIMDECFEITGQDTIESPVSSFSGNETDGEKRRTVDSGISFSSSSTRTSVQSHQTCPSTSSSTHSHSRNQSHETSLSRNVPESTRKPAGSTLERIAREIKKIRSRGDIREAAKSRAAPTVATDLPPTDNDHSRAPTPGKERKLHVRPSLTRMRSNSALKEKDPNSAGSAPSSRDGHGSDSAASPAFDVEEMKRKRMVWEARQRMNSGENLPATELYT